MSRKSKITYKNCAKGYVNGGTHSKPVQINTPYYLLGRCFNTIKINGTKLTNRIRGGNPLKNKNA